MKNEDKIVVILTDLLKSSEQFRQETNNNFVQIDMSLKMMAKQIQLSNERIDKLYEVDKKVRQLEKRVKVLESKG